MYSLFDHGFSPPYPARTFAEEAQKSTGRIPLVVQLASSDLNMVRFGPPARLDIETNI